jgi:hypothetical protein
MRPKHCFRPLADNYRIRCLRGRASSLFKRRNQLYELIRTIRALAVHHAEHRGFGWESPFWTSETPMIHELALANTSRRAGSPTARCGLLSEADCEIH